MKSLARIALVVSLMVSIGGHWGMLQAIAWAKMLQDYSAEKGVVEGIKDTFSGERPCPLCHKIIESQKEEQERAPASKEKTEPSLKWFCDAETSLFKLSAGPDEDTFAHGTWKDSSIVSQWLTTPPTPPPRTGNGVISC